MKKGEKVFSGFLVLIAVFFMIGSLNLTSLSELSLTSPGGYPVFVACLGLIFAGWIVLENRGKPAVDSEDDPGVLNRDVLVMIGFVALYFLMILLFRYTVATLVFTFLAIFYLKDRDWKQAAMVSFISTYMILVVFKYLFNVILP